MTETRRKRIKYSPSGNVCHKKLRCWVFIKISKLRCRSPPTAILIYSAEFGHCY